MALHSTANEFFTLLSSSTSTDAAQVVVENIEKISSPGRIWNEEKDMVRKLPRALESQLITNNNWKKLAWSVAKVEFQNHERRYIVRTLLSSSLVLLSLTLLPTNREVNHFPNQN